MHQAVDQSASFPVDQVLLRGGIHQYHQFSSREIAQPGHTGDDPVFRVERSDAGSRDVQVHLYQRLIVDPGPCLAEPGDLGERQHSTPFKCRGLGSGLCPVVGQCERDQHVSNGNDQTDIEHPRHQAAQSEREVDDQEDRPDQTTAQQHQ